MTRTRDRYLLVAAIVVQLMAIWFVHWIDTRGYMDTDIYRLGARAWLLGNEVFGDDLTPETPDTATLPFIYPPFAALLFVPLAWMSSDAAVVTVAVCSHLAILVTAYSLARSSPYLAPRAGQVAVATGMLMPLITLVEPARETINYGQINLVLMALVAADCLLPRTPWPRGLLAAPRDSADWWLDKMLETGNDFGTVYAGNLTLRSLLAKQELTGFALNSLWIIGSAVLLALAVLGIRYALRVRNVPLALMINAVLVLLVSPISWSHHWVWAAPALGLLFAMAVRHRWYGVLLVLGLALVTVLIGPQWYLPYTDDKELDWTFSQQIVGNAYTLFGIGFLIAAAVAHFRLHPPVDPPPAPAREGHPTSAAT
ncbi:glycosyltransferase 87 family protein [Saccharopolyspora taberi]|uniref:Glycosyltransferase 87 family protein n=1 Tax=Saccharopolyspora taberi TaxID=60895 RepID=A0ABN3VMP9_9PSEU